MSKTALRIFIEWVDKDLKLKGYEHREIIDKAKSLLPTEQKQIEDAFNEGRMDFSRKVHTDCEPQPASDYFTRIYGIPEHVDHSVDTNDMVSDEELVKSVYPDAIIMSDYNPMYGNGFAIRSKLECIGWNRYSRRFAWSDARKRIEANKIINQ